MNTRMTAGHKTPALTKLWVRVLLSISVSVAVGLAPYLGKLNVPLFTPLLALFPQSIAELAISFSTAAMSLVAAYVQFHSSDTTPIEDIERKFRTGIRGSVIFLALLLVLYFVTVTPVPYNGGVHRATFVTGFTGSRDPRCAHKSSAQCILGVTYFDEANIDAAFGEQEIRIAKALLVIVYVSFMSTVAYLAALITLRRAVRVSQQEVGGGREPAKAVR